MKKFLFFLPLVLMVFAYGCATSSDLYRVEQQSAANNAQLRGIGGSIDDINYSLKAENRRSKELVGMMKSFSQVNESLKSINDQLGTVLKNQADLENRAFSSSSKSGISEGRIDELRHEISDVNAKMDAMKALLMQKFSEMQQAQQQNQGGAAGVAGRVFGGATSGGAGQVFGGATSAAAGQGVVEALPDPNQMYHQAYLDYTNGNYDIAVGEFREYLKDFPDAAYAGNAQFWIGESLYSMKKYSEALPEFDKVIKNYPQSMKVPDAMVKKGYTLDALKRHDEAGKVYSEVVKKFPDSDAAKLAEERLKK